MPRSEHELPGRDPVRTTFWLDREAAPGAGPLPAVVDGLLATLRRRSERERRYELAEEVGHGAMATVFRARDCELGRRVALKMLERLPAGDSRAADQTLRFIAEAQVTGQLDHPGIVPVHELGIDSLGQLFFSMKLVRGDDFAGVLQQVKSDADGWTRVRALGVLLKVCEAMAFAHEKGVIHRDLKPANIMVGRFGETYVMDWGLARVLDGQDLHDLRWDAAPGEPHSGMYTVLTPEPATGDAPLRTLDGRVLGTPAYMAPELAAGHADETSPRTDVYSLGAILYQILTGSIPFVATGVQMTARAVLARVLAGPPPPVRAVNPEAPDALVAICDKAMARRPEQRYASALELAHDVQAYLEHRPVTAQRPSLRHALRLWVERNRAVAATAAMALSVLVALTVWFVVEQGALLLQSERLLDLMASRALRDEERDDLTPLLASGRARSERWLERTAALAERLPGYRAIVETGGEPPAPLGHDELAAIVGAIAELAAARGRVAGWLAEARAQPARAAAAAQVPWATVFADLAAQPAFADLPRVEQQGLVPLGKNLAGYWQFWLVASGDCPELRDGLPGPLRAGDGAVLVLLPGGDVEIGYAGPGSERNERPRRARLRPFLLAAHEATQAQYLRVMAVNPSRRQPGHKGHGVEYSLAHPVDSVSWSEAERFGRRLGVRLPHGDELEYAGRAGATGSAHFAGREAAQLRGLENLRDRAYGRLLRRQDVLPWDDAWPQASPVGTFAPNGFGLHDVGGNLTEWCATYYGPEDRPGAPDEPGTPEPFRLRQQRGANWGLPLEQVRASYVMFQRPDYSAHWCGVRLARDWQQP